MKKARNIAVIITLAAASVSCIISLWIRASFSHFLLNLALSVLIFGFLGIILQVIVFKVFPEEEKNEIDDSKEDEEQDEEESSSIEFSNDQDDEDE